MNLTIILMIAFLIGITFGHFTETRNKIYQLETILSEMNNRQKSVVVTQHKAIEDKIAEMCGR